MKRSLFFPLYPCTMKDKERKDEPNVWKRETGREADEKKPGVKQVLRVRVVEGLGRVVRAYTQRPRKRDTYEKKALSLSLPNQLRES